MSIQHFFIRGEYLGQTIRDKYYIHEQLVRPWGVAFFCPHCSELWAVCPIEGRQSAVLTMVCDKHPANGLEMTPGSILVDWDKSYSSSLPSAVLRRELILNFNLAEKEGKL
jgi:hypothetical protein